MIVVDVEMSGVDPRKHSVLSIGAVEFDNPKNQFYGECRMFDGAKIMKEALAVNGFSEKQAKDPTKQTEAELIEKFLYWAKQCNDKVFAGSSTHLDWMWLKEAAHRAKLNWPFHHRIVDLHSICHYHIRKRGEKIPFIKDKYALNTDYALKYVGLPEEPKPHNGLNGAKFEAEAFNRFFNKKVLLEEFEKYPIPEYL